MTVSNTTKKQLYAGNGSTTTFAIPFDFNANSEVVVYLRDENVTPATQTLQVDPTHYSITGGNPGTNVEMVTAPASTEKLLVARRVAQTQATDYLETGEFPADTHEEALDKLTRMVQDTQERLDRSPQLPDSTTISDLQLTEPVASELLRWNATGTGIESVASVSVDALNLLGGNGLLARTSTSDATARTLQGTANEIVITTGDGVAGNPVIGIADNPVFTGTEGVQIPSGSTAQRPGTPVNGDFRYNSTNNAFEYYQNSQWVDVSNPIGTISAYGGTAAPNGWLLCDGSTVSRTTYAALYAVTGDAFGEGDGSTTFHLPDLRGRFLRGRDATAGRDPDAGTRTAMNTNGNTGDAVGSIQADATAQANTPFAVDTGGSHSHTFRGRGGASTDAVGFNAITGNDGDPNIRDVPYTSGLSGVLSTGSTHSHTLSGGDTETRPINAYVNYIIKH